MTQQKKRIKLAIAHGWELKQCRFHGCDTWHSPEGVCADGDDYPCLPDYFNDLNVVHALEMSLSLECRNHYVERLRLTLGAGQYLGAVTVCATAAQRAEALGNSLGLWKGSAA